MVDWNPLTKRLQYVLALKPTPMARLYDQVNHQRQRCFFFTFFFQYLNNLKDTDHVEISPRREILIQKIFNHVSKCHGGVLIGDYAYWGKTHDSFRVNSCGSIVHEIRSIDH